MSIFIREMKMPLTIRAFTVPDENGDYNIYINITCYIKRLTIK